MNKNIITQDQIIQESDKEQNIIQLNFDGIFQGREHEIRITPDKKIYVYDFIKVVYGLEKHREVWRNILKTHEYEIAQFLTDISYIGTLNVINVQGMVKLLFLLHGESVKQFRGKSAEAMIMYLDGDQELIDELHKNIKMSIPLKFDGIFQGREHEIRITPDKRISVFDFIKVAGGQENPQETWEIILREHKDEIIQFLDYAQFGKTKKTPVVNVHRMVKLLFWLPGELVKQFRSKSAEAMIIYLSGDQKLVDELYKNNGIEEITLDVVPNNQSLVFDGIFSGRELEIRITPDKQISVFDFIKFVGGQANPKQTWKNVLNNHKDEIVQFLDYSQFGKTKKTPVVNVQGMVKLLFWLPGELAKQFRSKSAEVMIRYLGGDLTLIDEIKTINQHHIDHPNNVARVFREEIISKLNYDQLNNSKQLLSHFGCKTNILYMLLFTLTENWYLKFGIVNVRCFFERFNEHFIELGPDICVMDAFQSPDITMIESEHKNSTFFKQHKTTLPKKNGGNHTEIYQLSETLTYDMIKKEIIKTAGERITDPPPNYIAIENGDSERTKQIEYQEITKQAEEVTKQIECQEITKQKQIDYQKITKQVEEETKQKQIEFNIKKLEFEMMKYNK